MSSRGNFGSSGGFGSNSGFGGQGRGRGQDNRGSRGFGRGGFGQDNDRQGGFNNRGGEREDYRGNERDDRRGDWGSRRGFGQDRHSGFNNRGGEREDYRDDRRGETDGFGKSQEPSRSYGFGNREESSNFDRRGANSNNRQNDGFGSRGGEGFGNDRDFGFGSGNRGRRGEGFGYQNARGQRNNFVDERNEERNRGGFGDNFRGFGNDKKEERSGYDRDDSKDGFGAKRGGFDRQESGTGRGGFASGGRTRNFDRRVEVNESEGFGSGFRGGRRGGSREGFDDNFGGDKGGFIPRPFDPQDDGFRSGGRGGGFGDKKDSNFDGNKGGFTPRPFNRQDDGFQSGGRGGGFDDKDYSNFSGNVGRFVPRTFNNSSIGFYNRGINRGGRNFDNDGNFGGESAPLGERAPAGWLPEEREVEDLYNEDKNMKNIFTEDDHDQVEVKGGGRDQRFKSWYDSNLHKTLIDILIKKRGFLTARPIQSATIPQIQQGYDVITKAETGSGKTLAFVLPIIDSILKNPGPNRRNTPLAVILEPTRELADQVYQDFKRMVQGTGVNVTLNYGQMDSRSINLTNVDIYVGTIGRLKDFMEKGRVYLNQLRFFVLDEADQMLKPNDMGGLDCIINSQDFSSTAEYRQNLLYSATMDRGAFEIAKKLMEGKKIAQIFATGSRANKHIKQIYVEISCKADKTKYLENLFEKDSKEGKVVKSLVFVAKKVDSDVLANQLSLLAGTAAESINGDRPQNLRNTVMNNFRTGRTSLLVGTDVCARGLDIPSLDRVILYDMPMRASDVENSLNSLAHRIGRTGRVREGTAIIFIDSSVTSEMAMGLCKMAKEVGQEPPRFLVKIANGGGDFFRGSSRYGGETSDEFGYSNGFEKKQEGSKPNAEFGLGSSEKKQQESSSSYNVDESSTGFGSTGGSEKKKNSFGFGFGKEKKKEVTGFKDSSSSFGKKEEQQDSFKYSPFKEESSENKEVPTRSSSSFGFGFGAPSSFSAASARFDEGFGDDKNEDRREHFNQFEANPVDLKATGIDDDYSSKKPTQPAEFTNDCEEPSEEEILVRKAEEIPIKMGEIKLIEEQKFEEIPAALEEVKPIEEKIAQPKAEEITIPEEEKTPEDPLTKSKADFNQSVANPVNLETTGIDGDYSSAQPPTQLAEFPDKEPSDLANGSVEKR